MRLILTLLFPSLLYAQSVTLDSEYIGATAAELTIATGAVTASDSATRFKIDTEADAATDDLDTITQASTGQTRITLTTVNDNRDVTLKDGTGNLVLGRDVTIDNANDDWVELLYEGSSWYLFRTSEDIDGFAATASQVTTNTTDISSNDTDITNLQNDKLGSYDNKTLFDVDSDNENTQAITADLTLSNETGGAAPAAAEKARQYLTTDADTWAAILPSTSTYPRLIWNRDTTNDILIEISPSATVEATLKPGDKAYCIYVGSAWVIELVRAYNYQVPIIKSAGYTIGTDTEDEQYGGIFIVDTAATLTLPAVGYGMSVTVITEGAIAVSVDTNASDLMYLDGVALDDGDKATNTSTSGDIIKFIYYDATGWFATSNGWTDGGA